MESQLSIKKVCEIIEELKSTRFQEIHDHIQKILARKLETADRHIISRALVYQKSKFAENERITELEKR